MAGTDNPTVACFATQGTGSLDEDRVRELLALVDAEVLLFDRRGKVKSGLRLLRAIARSRPALVVMEGTGVMGGAAMIGARLLIGTRYVVSSGDAVAPFVRLSAPSLGPLAAVYERILYRLSSGFIGWSPYLVGRALTLGAPRAMTAANWAPAASSPDGRSTVRRDLGIADDAIVFGLVGSLGWTERVGYCYGLELVEAVLQVDREDVVVLVVGDGDGRERLAERAGSRLGRSVLLPGRVPREAVASYLSALDVASLPQSVDAVGAFRYTTKISEYLDAGLPIVTGELPLAYDLDDGWLWRLPGNAPWDSRYVTALSELMLRVTRDELERRRGQVPRRLQLFDRQRQQRQAAAFVADILDAR